MADYDSNKRWAKNAGRKSVQMYLLVDTIEKLDRIIQTQGLKGRAAAVKWAVEQALAQASQSPPQPEEKPEELPPTVEELLARKNQKRIRPKAKVEKKQGSEDGKIKGKAAADAKQQALAEQYAKAQRSISVCITRRSEVSYLIAKVISTDSRMEQGINGVYYLVERLFLIIKDGDKLVEAVALKNDVAKQWVFVKPARSRYGFPAGMDGDLPDDLNELRKLMSQHHPDKNPAADLKLFQRIKEKLDTMRGR
jgi:hypothetical protein